MFSFKSKLSKIEKDKKVNFNSKLIKVDVDGNNFRKILADNLVNGDIVIADLTDREVEEMIEFFTRSIEEIDEELIKRKNNILKIKNKIAEMKKL